MSKKHVFNAGPCILPQEALDATVDAIKDFAGTGVSLLCISHRTKEWDAVMDETRALWKELLNIPEGYEAEIVSDTDKTFSLGIKGLKNTLQLASSSLVLAILTSFPLGILSAVKKGRLIDHIVRLLSFIGNSLPNFLISVLLMYLLCIKIKLFPVIADGSLKGLLLPAISLAVPMAGRFTRQIRTEISEQLSEEYVMGMKSRHIKTRFILINNVLRNALGHILTIIGLQIGTLMGGSVVIENIFRWPGIGKLVMDSITARDYPVIMGFVLIMGTIYVVINLIVDISYHILDPRSI